MRILSLIKVSMLLFTLCSMYCLSLNGMEIIEDDLRESAFPIIALNQPHNVRERYCLFYFVNKACNESVESSCKIEKKLIEKHIQDNKIEVNLPVIGKRSWNYQLNQCAWVSYNTLSTHPKKLRLTLAGRVDDKTIVNTADFNGFGFPVFEDKIYPSFDQSGQAVFYGYGKTTSDHGKAFAVAQYCADINGVKKRSRCFFGFDHPTQPNARVSNNLSMLLQYPVLLQAVLQSTSVSVLVKGAGSHDSQKIYVIDGVTLPENYKEFKKSFLLEQMEKLCKKCLYRNFKSYDSLPGNVKKGIDDHYQKQQEKINHNGENC